MADFATPEIVRSLKEQPRRLDELWAELRVGHVSDALVPLLERHEFDAVGGCFVALLTGFCDHHLWLQLKAKAGLLRFMKAKGNFCDGD